jgi:PKD domain-containing protein
MNSTRLVLAAVLALLLSAHTASAATWQAPKTVSAVNTSNTSPAVAVNARGDAAVLWTRKSDTSVQTATRAAGGSWSAAALAGSPADGTPRIGIDDAGHGYAVWAVDISSNNHPVLASVSGPGGWSQPVDISAPAFGGFDPALAVNGRGDAVAAWVGFDGTGSTIVGAVKPANGAWSAPRLVSPGPTSDAAHPEVAIDDHGNAVVVWTRFGRVERAFYSNAAWSSPAWVSAANRKASYPKIAIDEHGHFTAVWESTSGYGYTVVSRAGGWLDSDFGAPAEIGFAGKSTDPSIFVSPSGAAVLAWVRDNGGHHVIEATQRSGAPGASWASAKVLSNPLSNSGSPRAADGLVAWDQATVAGNHLVYASDFRAGAWSYQHLVGGPGSGAAHPQVASDSAGDGVLAFARGTAIQTVDHDAAPVLSGVQAPASGAVGQKLSFAAAAGDLWSPVAIAWNFGDGKKAAGSPATHAYAAPGDYTVTVTARDAVGNVSSSKRVVQVPVPAKPPAKPPKPGEPPTGTQPSPPSFAGLRLKRQTAVVRKRVARVKAKCPVATTGACAGTLRLLSGRKVIGRARFKIAAGKTARIRVKVKRVVRVGRASARTHDGLGATRTTSAKLKFRRG